MIHYIGTVWWERLAGRKFDGFGELSVILQTKAIQSTYIVVTINNPLADLFICKTFSAKCLKRVNSSRQTFPLYGIHIVIVYLIFYLNTMQCNTFWCYAVRTQALIILTVALQALPTMLLVFV